MSNPDPAAEVERLSAELERAKEKVSQYRELVRRLATAKDKADAWYRAKAWCPFWRDIAFDLPSEAEQKAMLFE